MKILVINPGSTSTKISVFEDRKPIFTQSVFHDAPLMLSFKTTNDQLPYRKKVTLDLLAEHGISMQDIDIIVGRGGSAHTQTGGLTIVDQTLYTNTKEEVAKTDHAAKLGVMIAFELSQKYHKPAFTLNPTNMDELQDVARITGIKGLYRRPQSHALNQKAIAQLHAQKLGKKIEDCNFIVAHIDGGITVGAHKNGKMIDCTEGAGGDGPFTPTRIGSIPVLEMVRFLENGHTTAEIRALCSHSGGYISYLGTSDTQKVYELVKAKDPQASLIWEAMLYQISKCIGEMATVLKGKVDAIILTGGLVRYQEIVTYITEHCSFIAPIATYPGEVEQEAMAWAVCDYLEGKTQPKKYVPQDVFTGFPWAETID
jgi:butyrate kinase